MTTGARAGRDALAEPRAGRRVALLAVGAAVLAAFPPAQAAGPAKTRANPASENCIRLDGVHEVQKRGDGGEYGVCRFADGRQCEEWALLRGSCPRRGVDVFKLATPAARYCAMTGGTYHVTGAAGGENETGTCTLPGGSTCDAAEYFAGTCKAASAPPAQADPFAYCAAVGDVDAPDARYGGPPLPEAVGPALVRQGVLAADAPAELRRQAVWRCRDREVVACLPGADSPCLEKADDSEVPAVAATLYCTANPSAETVPAALTGWTTVWAWGCREGRPAIAGRRFHADARGFLDELWHRVQRPEGPASSNPSDIGRVRVSHDGRLALLPIDPDNVDATKELIQSNRLESRGLVVSLYQPVGLLPQILVSGEPEAVSTFVATAKEMFLPTGRKHLVAISARLTQFSDSEIRDLGINLFPSSVTYSGALTKEATTGWATEFSLNVNQSGANNIIVADESLGSGKALVASQVFTPNGVKADISDVQHEPVFSLDTYGNVQTEYRDLETNIAVTPVVLDFSQEAGAAGRVRLDITVKVSLISGEKRTANVTAPQYSDKSFKTTRVFPADGRTYLVGSFVSDSDIESRSGVPWLSSIPLIKYLFSQKSTTRSRNYALLTLAVSVLPDDLTSDDLARQQADTTKSAAAKGGRKKPEELSKVPSILDQALESPQPAEPAKAP
ncbi:MAG: DUF333 domain-containing protein [Thermoanaerobaculia bacterium]